MGRTSDDIMEAFATGGRPGRAGNVSCTEDTLYSYRMVIARKIRFRGRPFFLINGDGAPSKTTSKHQGMMRSAIRDSPRAFIPFSALRAANIPEQIVEIVHATDDFEIPRWEPCRHTQRCKPSEVDEDGRSRVENGEVWHNYARHFLGECLFCVKSLRWNADGDARELVVDHYVCGLDRNDRPDRRMFYLAKLPEGAHPRTVDEALAALRPADVPEGSPRQGEWFFVPSPIAKPHTAKPEDWRRVFNFHPASKVEVVREKNKKPEAGENDSAWQRRRNREMAVVTTIDPARKGSFRHYASEVIRVAAVLDGRREERVLARGRIRDEEHDTLVLPEGWHLAVKNLAVEGWRAGNGGASVD